MKKKKKFTILQGPKPILLQETDVQRSYSKNCDVFFNESFEFFLLGACGKQKKQGANIVKFTNASSRA